MTVGDFWRLARAYAIPHLSSKTEMVTVKGIAGLANRLLFAVGATQFAERFGLDIVIDWRDGMYSKIQTNAFDELFQLKRDWKCRERSGGDTTHPTCWQGHLEKSVYEMRAAVYPDPSSPMRADPNFLMSNFADVVNEKPQVTNLVMAGFYYQKRELRWLKVRESARSTFQRKFSLESSVKKFVKSQIPTSPYVSVHVRRSDSAQHIDTKKYFSAIDIGPELPVYLATDSRSVEEDFLRKYGSRMISVERFYPAEGKSLHHTNAGDKGIKAVEAIRDLYCLAGGSTIIKGNNSSFGDFAHELIASDSQECVEVQ